MALYKLSEGCLSIADAAKRAGVSRSAMYQAIQSGRLPNTKFPGITTVVSIEDVDAFIERRKNQRCKSSKTSSLPTLEILAAQITDENRHAEVDFGQAVGNEVW